MDVLVQFSDLKTLKRYLDAIITEFEEAENNANALESAIGYPFGRSELLRNVADFENRWDDKRDELKEDITGVRDHIQGVLDGFSDWDKETSASFDEAANSNASSYTPSNGGYAGGGGGGGYAGGR